MRGVQKYKRRRKYRLYMAFVSASQLREEEVLFEVSMGNYGNVLDDTLPASGSTPPSVCPQYDGQRYHFAPWAESKPCVLLESHWEDIEYRLGALNMLLRVLDRLVCTPLLPPHCLYLAFSNAAFWCLLKITCSSNIVFSNTSISISPK